MFKYLRKLLGLYFKYVMQLLKKYFAMFFSLAMMFPCWA